MRPDSCALFSLVFKASASALDAFTYAPEGGTLAFGVNAAGTLPITFRWLSNAVAFTNGIVFGSSTSSFLLLNRNGIINFARSFDPATAEESVTVPALRAYLEDHRNISVSFSTDERT
jgi:hypothetical protein